jgi:hypothetical protein
MAKRCLKLSLFAVLMLIIEVIFSRMKLSNYNKAAASSAGAL